MYGVLTHVASAYGYSGVFLFPHTGVWGNSPLLFIHMQKQHV